MREATKLGDNVWFPKDKIIAIVYLPRTLIITFRGSSPLMDMAKLIQMATANSRRLYNRSGIQIMDLAHNSNK